MLIGILCDVVHLTSRTERDKAAVENLRTHLMEILESHDAYNDGCIEREEFELLMKNPEMSLTLYSVGVDIDNLISLKHVMFEHSSVRLRGTDYSKQKTLTGAPLVEGEGGRKLSFNEFVDIVLGLRGGNNTTVSDIVYLREYMRQRLDQIEQRFDNHSGCAREDSMAPCDASSDRRDSRISIASSAPTGGRRDSRNDSVDSAPT